MAERITITMPDSLHERLQAVKEKLNVSAVCQKAIELAIQIEEIKMKDVPVKEKVIERLRAEKKVSDAEWKKIGFQNGLKDAEELSYDEFQALINGDEIDGKIYFSEDIDDWLHQNRFQYLKNPNKELYRDGWVEGALHFWEEIKEQI